MRPLLSACLSAVLACALPGALLAEPLPLDRIMQHPDWIGPPVESAWWSLHDDAAYYVLKRAGSPIRDVHRIDLDSGDSAVVEGAALAQLDGADAVYDATRSRAAFVRNGDVFVRARPGAGGGALRQLTRGANAAALRFSADADALLYRQGQDWFRVRLDDGRVEAVALPRIGKDPADPPAPDQLREHQLRLIATLARQRDEREALRTHGEAQRAADPTRGPGPVYLGEKLVIADSALSPAGRWLLVATEAEGGNGGQGGKMPTYVTESGYEGFEDVRTRVGRNAPLGQSLRLVDLADGSVRTLSLAALPGIATDPLADLRKAAGKPALEGERPLRVMALRWNPQGTQAAVMLRANDNKDRWIATVDLEGGALRPLHRLTDPGWINWSFNEFDWMPDGQRLWFLSEESGHAHLLLAAPGERPRALTSGAWEVSDPALTPDGTRFVFLCNRAWPGGYELCARDVDGRGEVRELTALGGVEDFRLSPSGDRILLRHSSHHTPPQLAVMAADGSGLRTLTDTRSPEYAAQTWLAPQYVRVPSSHVDGEIWGKLYRPATLEPGKRYPIVFFVHGAGYLQNVWARWPNYFREQMFHQRLVEQGYIVLDLDFRGSAGYGRDWRTAVYRQMGHPELEDYVDAIDWLVEQHQGDRGRVGIYGGSYGGFMTFMALFREPGRFHAGAALRPVTDWMSYNHEYTSNILNTPDIDPEAYRRSSPIEYVERLQGHLLISHGMIDDNVFYQDSVRLAQRLIELKKHRWELASYPLERHGYVQPESWYDQYRRIDELFQRALAPAAAP